LQKEISQNFIDKYVAKIKLLKSGDPLNEDTFIGVLAREDLAKDLEKQVNDSLKMGAKILVGGNREGAYYEPTLITDVTKNMPVFNQETFGPAICVVTFDSVEEAIEISNDSDFGLGVSLFTTDISKAEKIAYKFNEGAVFINEMVKSDPRLPFGGIKTSGYGRELSHYGIKEFVNIKTIYINK
jgi:succinate-semialdehyde dehydrogenase/glutarate-semialdehyde dehydrogenase